MYPVAPASFPSAPIKIVHSHNDLYKQSDHGHSPSHHSHSHSQPRMPSSSPMPPFPISPSASFHVQSQSRSPAVPLIRSSSPGLLKVPSASPHVHFALPHRSPIRSSSSNGLYKAASPGYNQSNPLPKQSTKHNTERTPLNPDFQYSKCTGRRRALCVCLLSLIH